MSKAPSPRADALRAQREARYGHLQAHAERESANLQANLAAFATPRTFVNRAELEKTYPPTPPATPKLNETALLASIPRKKVPYAGKPKGGTNSGEAAPPVDRSPEAVAARKAIAAKRKPRKAKS